MSQDNVEVVREAFEAFNRGDFDAALERMHPAIEWQALDAFPDAGTYRGRDEVRHFWRALAGHLSWFSLALGGVRTSRRAPRPRHLPSRGEGAGSGAGVESPTVFQLGEIRDGQVTWVGMFSTESEALEAAGLSE